MSEENPVADQAASRYASRKFIIAMLAVLALIALFAFKRLGEDAFISGLLWLVGLYSGANVAQKATERLGTKPTP